MKKLTVSIFLINILLSTHLQAIDFTLYKKTSQEQVFGIYQQQDVFGIRLANGEPERTLNTDLYIMVQLPNKVFYFLQENNHVSDIPSPYQTTVQQQETPLKSRANLFDLKLPDFLPAGKYNVFIAEMKAGQFGINEIVGEISQEEFEYTPQFIKAEERRNSNNGFSTPSLPFGYVNELYQFKIKVINGTAPYRFESLTESLPEGLTFNSEAGTIQGIPTQSGETSLNIKIIDKKGYFGFFQKKLIVLDIVTFGEEELSKDKDCSPFFKILNENKKYREIRVQQGTYFCHDLLFSGGFINLSGGWDKTFTQQTQNPKLTVFDAQQKGRILKLIGGEKNISYFTFKNGFVTSTDNYSGGGAIIAASVLENTVSHSHFINNQAMHMPPLTDFTTDTSSLNLGGAINGIPYINNSYFYNNKAEIGGAVAYSIFLVNNQFKENTATIAAGAILNGIVSEFGIIPSIMVNNLFNRNKAQFGGAVLTGLSQLLSFNNTYVNNSATLFCGALCLQINDTKIRNDLFFNNFANQQKNDIEARSGKADIDFSLINHINTASDVDYADFTNRLFSHNTILDKYFVDQTRSLVTLGEHLVRGDPLFVNSHNDDYHLSINSPSFDKGTASLDEVYLDFFKNIVTDFSFLFLNEKGQFFDLDNKIRPLFQNIDIGAYERL